MTGRAGLWGGRRGRLVALGVTVGTLAGLQLLPAPRAQAGLVFPATADATIRSDKPKANFGSATTLTALNSNPAKQILFKFTVSGIGSATVATANLRLRVTNASPQGGDLYPVAINSWAENTVTWNTAPPTSSTQPIASLAAVAKGTWVNLNVTSYIRGDGIYSLRLVTPSNDAVTYTSKETTTGKPPQLIMALAADTTAPTVAITDPADRATVSGTQSVQATATDNVGVARVEFRLDGTVTATDTTSPYQWNWNTAGSTNASHILTAAAYDAAGNVGGSASVTVTVDNPVDTAGPSPPGNLTAVAANGNRVNVCWTASTDDVGVAGYRVVRDGTQLADQAATSYVDWGVNPFTTYSYQVIAYDAAGHVSTPSSVPVTTPAPLPSFTFGAAGDFGANPTTDASFGVLDRSDASYFLALGDLDYDQTPTDADWCTYVQGHLPTKGPNFPFELVTGNHEEQGGPNGYILNHAACLPDRMNSTIEPGSRYAAEYTFDYPRDNPLIRTILISPDLTVDNVTYNYAAGGPHYTWLAGVIDDARSQGIPWVVVGMHKVCLTAGAKSCEIGTDLLNLLVQKRVDLVLEGHDHNYQRSGQLALNPVTCPAMSAGVYTAGCVTDSGTDNEYDKGAGAVVVIGGTFGRSLYTVDASDSERPYFCSINDLVNGLGLYTVSADRLEARFVSGAGTVLDAFRFDARAPSLQVTSGPADSAVSQQAVATYAGSSIDPGGSVTRVETKVDGGAFSGTGVTCTNCGTPAATWSWTTPPLTDGGHSLAFRAVDSDGNTSAVMVRTLTIDTEPPTLAISGGPADGSTTSDPAPSFSGTSSDAITAVTEVEASVDGAAFSTDGVTCNGCGSASATWTWSPLVPPGDGPHTFAFQALDTAGNVSAESVLTVTIDTTTPPP